MRQRSRAFIVADASSPDDRVIFINAGMFPLDLPDINSGSMG